MKRLILIGVTGVLAACSHQPSSQSAEQSKNDTISASAKNTEQYFGEKIIADSAKPVSTLKDLMGSQTQLHIKLEGEIEAVCQKKGCWMDLKNTNGEKVRVTFKDYKFFMPKDCAGKTAVVDGVASIEETSVDELKEYAKDAGKSKEEIAAIKEPKKELVFEASGVILR